MKATARAPSNVALVKYWGKRDRRLNLPATGSISVTLDGLETVTTVAFDRALDADTCTIDGTADPRGARRVLAFLDLVRTRFGVTEHARVRSRNDFPTGAGLASSASGFAALTVAIDAALGLGLSREELSALARRGSGSAARSLIDGFAEMRAGTAEDGSDAFAVALGPPDLCPMDVLAVVTTHQPKAVGSTEGMERTERTSPYYRAWVEQTLADLDAMREALRASDLERVGTIAEENAMRMHAAMLASSPPLLYWNGTTLDVVREVARLRQGGEGAWVTIDAGPQVKVLCAPGRGEHVAARIEAVGGVLAILRSRPGRGAHVVEDAA
ncbi:MAG: diphosphomevalonate decarboxylase [Planctomycetota bacterium]